MASHIRRRRPGQVLTYTLFSKTKDLSPAFKIKRDENNAENNAVKNNAFKLGSNLATKLHEMYHGLTTFQEIPDTEVLAFDVAYNENIFTNSKARPTQYYIRVSIPDPLIIMDIYILFSGDDEFQVTITLKDGDKVKFIDLCRQIFNLLSRSTANNVVGGFTRRAGSRRSKSRRSKSHRSKSRRSRR
jgi:hypothetical protein